MKYLIFLILNVLYFNIAEAKVFLIASEKSNFEAYANTCKANNYYCMPLDYDKTNQMEKPLFTKLTEEFNLDNDSYNLSFFAKVQTVIAQEMLTLDDFELLIFMSEKICKQSKLKSHDNDLNSLKSIYIHLKKITSENNFSDSTLTEKMFYIAGRKLAYNDKVLNYINKNLNSVFTQVISYDSVETLHANQKQFFLQGDCGKYTFWQSDLNNFNLTLMPYFNQGCSFGEKIERQSTSIGHHFQEHQNKYLWGLAIVVGGLLLNSKPIVIEY